MSLQKVDEMKLDIEELERLATTATRPKVKDILTIEWRKLETKLISLKAQQESQVNSSGPKQASSAPKCYEVKLTNYAWDQSDKFVKIFVTLKNVQTLEPELINCKFSPRGMELHVNGLDNRNYVLPIINLLENLDESKSHWKVKNDMVVVFLAKENSGKNWPHLTASEMKAKEPKVPNMSPGEDPSSDLMNLMKKMYDEGDDEMKRTIAKAWTESREKHMNTTF